MLFWMIVGALCVLLIAFFIYKSINDGENWLLPAVIAALIALIIFTSVPLNKLTIEQNTNLFLQQAAYFQTHVPQNEIENAAITTKKVELNAWLYNAQWAKRKFGILSLYPKEILDWEPIQ